MLGNAGHDRCMAPLEQRQNIGIQHEEVHGASASSIGVVFDFLAVLCHRLHPFINEWIVLEHPGKLHRGMPGRANLETYQFRPFLEAGLDFRPELGQSRVPWVP
jgi:hypothetical protein